MSGSTKRVLITGIHGFTGQYLKSELLRYGHHVYGLGIHDLDEPGYFKADLSDPRSLARAVDNIRPQWVAHLAAISFVGHGNPNDFYKINLMGTRNLLEALARKAQPPECVLLAGSANIYGNVHGVIREGTPANPANDYAVSKLAMEYMAALWKPKLPLVITRPFNYTGVGQSTDFLLPKIAAHFREKAPVIELGNLEVSRDFSDVRVIAHAYRRLLEERPSGEIINICSGRATSLKKILGIAESITGHRIEVRVNPSFIRKNEIKSLWGDPGKLRSIIGQWDPLPLEDTLGWMLLGSNEQGVLSNE